MKPTRSQNRTDTSLRSSRGASPSAGRTAPQARQNRARVGFSSEQTGQVSIARAYTDMVLRGGPVGRGRAGHDHDRLAADLDRSEADVVAGLGQEVIADPVATVLAGLDVGLDDALDLHAREPADRHRTSRTERELGVLGQGSEEVGRNGRARVAGGRWVDRARAGNDDHPAAVGQRDPARALVGPHEGPDDLAGRPTGRHGEPEGGLEEPGDECSSLAAQRACERVVARGWGRSGGRRRGCDRCGSAAPARTTGADEDRQSDEDGGGALMAHQVAP